MPDIIGEDLTDEVSAYMEAHFKPKDMKYDQGKLQAAILFEDFPDALRELMKVCDFGAKKYERSSWKTVSNGKQRYTDARARHFTDSFVDEYDPESTISHLAHEAWNCLAVLQLKLEEQKPVFMGQTEKAT